MGKKTKVESQSTEIATTTPKGVSLPYFMKDAPDAGKMKFKRVSLAPIVPLASMPDQAVIFGKIVGLQDSPVSRIKSKLIRLDMGEKGEVLITANRALANVILRQAEKGGEITCPYIGKCVIIKRIGTRRSNNFKKNYPIFDIQIED